MPDDVLDTRALGRATLARQFLLERARLGVIDAVQQLVGLQAQIPANPYLALWSRLEPFDPEVLSSCILDRSLVRIAAMRSTLHLLTVDDALQLRPLMQPVLNRELERHRDFGPPLVGVDMKEVLAYARGVLEEQPRTGAQLRAALGERFPDLDAAALAYACRNQLALVQVPPRGLWGRSGQVATTPLEHWVGRPLAAEPRVDDVVLRYLRAFGPATVADVAAWSHLTGLREVVERLRSQLRRFRDERGRELFDLPDAPRPSGEVEAPARFLPEYDNAVLSHADRSRFAPDEARGEIGRATKVQGTVLADGRLAATWYREPASGGHPGDIVVEHLSHVTKRTVRAIEREGERMAAFQTGASQAGAGAAARPAVRVCAIRA